MRALLIDDEFGAAIALMFGFARCARNDGIHGTARFRRYFFDAKARNDALDGIGTAFAECHIVLFSTAFVAVTDDLQRADVATRLEALGVFFDRRFGIGTDRRFVEVEVRNARLANGRIDALFVFADLASGAIFVDEALGLGHATVVFAQVIFGAIFGNGFGIAFGPAATITAFLTGRAIDANFGIAVAIDALARATIADITFVALARAVLVIAAFCAFGIEAVFIRRFSDLFCRTIVVVVTFRIRGRTTICQTNHEASHYGGEYTPTFKHRLLLAGNYRDKISKRIYEGKFTVSDLMTIAIRHSLPK